MPTAHATCFAALQSLGWPVQFANETVLIAFTPSTSKRNENKVTVEVTEQGVNVVSEMVHDQLFDLLRLTKADVQQFKDAFECTLSRGENLKETVGPRLKELIEKCHKEALDLQQAMEVMCIPTSAFTLTNTIAALNVLVFLGLFINGGGFFEANGAVHIKWGSNVPLLTLSGDGWRLVSNLFLHFGVMHLALNTVSLLNVGVLLEGLLGRVGLFCAYVASGIFASITSAWWHEPHINSAGASGAIFGLYGLFFGMLTLERIHEAAREVHLKETGYLLLFNLAYGLKEGIDNAAHIGGLLAGLFFAVPFILALENMANEKKRRARPGLLFLAAAVAAAHVFLDNHREPQYERRQFLLQLEREISGTRH